MAVNVNGALLAPALVQGVFVVTCSGLVTARTVKAIRTWLAAAMPADARAAVIDYRACCLVITDDEMQGLARPDRPLSPPAPLAWVVADEATADLWRRQVLRLAMSGQRRYVSRDPMQAFAWAQAQAQLAQPEWSQAGPPAQATRWPRR